MNVAALDIEYGLVSCYIMVRHPFPDLRSHHQDIHDGSISMLHQLPRISIIQFIFQAAY